MLKKSASGVLASLRGSRIEENNYWRLLSVRQESFEGRTAHTKCGMYLLASSLAAALLNGLFEQPAWSYAVVSDMRTIGFLGSQHRYAAVG
jgi:hypothetical protein